MAYHTARLVITVILLTLFVAGMASGSWATAFFWALIACAVGYPFVRGGRIDLYYDDAPVRVEVVAIPVKGGAQPGGMMEKLAAGSY